MNKKEFLKKLSHKLSKNENKVEIVSYYDELIDEAISNGENETLFIENLGNIDDIVSSLNEDDTKTISESKKSSKTTNPTFTKIIITLSKIGYVFLYVVSIFFLLSVVFNSVSSIVEFVIYIFKYMKDSSIIITIYYIFDLIITAALLIYSVYLFDFIFKKGSIYYNKMVDKLNNYYYNERKI